MSKWDYGLAWKPYKYNFLPVNTQPQGWALKGTVLGNINMVKVYEQREADRLVIELICRQAGAR
jgi:hypothetical protein